MAEQADLYIHNTSMVDINVIRNFLGDFIEPPVTIASGNLEQFYLGGTDVSLNIIAPVGVDTKYYSIKIRSDVDVMTKTSRTDSSWTIKIEPNDLPPDTPTTVNVYVGEDEPE